MSRDCHTLTIVRVTHYPMMATCEETAALLLLWMAFLLLRRVHSTRRQLRRRQIDRMKTRRRRLIVMAVLCAYRSYYSPRIVRTVWCKPRTRHWWRAVQGGVVGNEWWKENLRMSRDTFMFVCGKLRPFIEKQVTNFRSPVSVEERVAVTIWKLATNIEYRTLSSLFGLGRSTVGKIVVETCRAIATHLLPQYVQIPCGEKLKEIVDGFETFWGFPQAAGAIDGSHIPIIRPEESASDYYNRKGYYSIIVQALVDHLGLFMDVCIGWPGKVHDARVFVNSSLYQRGRTSTLFPDWKRTINGVEVPLVILGDPAYPSLPWVMKPYPETAATTAEQKCYNYRQSRARMVVENAFGRLKGQWRCLLKRMDFKLENVPHAVSACIVLHNMCELYGDNFLKEWTDHLSTGSLLPPPAPTSSGSIQASDIRDAIMQHLSSS